MIPFTKTFKSGMYLFREKDRSRELYIIQSGSVKVYRTAGGKKVELAILKKGAVFGEMALIDGKPRSASVIAIEDSKVIIIDADAFLSSIKGIPPWFFTIIRNTSQKIRQANLRLKSISSNFQGAKIIITLWLYFNRFDKGNNGLSVETIQNHSIQLLGVTYSDVTNTLDFLCKHSFITVQDDNIFISDFSRLEDYAEYCTFILRNQINNLDPLDKTLAALAECIGTTFNENLKGEVSFTNIEGEQFYHMLKNNNLDENCLNTIEQLQKDGYLTFNRKQKSTDSYPLGDLTIRLIHLPWKRAYLFYTFLNDQPESL